MQLKRRHQQLAHSLKLADASEQIEQGGCVLAKIWTAGEQAQISVDAGCGRIVIPGREVDIAADRVIIPPNHQANLGVNLVTD